MASQMQIRPEPADHYLCHPNIMPDSAFCKSLEKKMSFFATKRRRQITIGASHNPIRQA